MRVIQKKVCMLGDFAVGKTSLVRRYIEGRFDDKYLSTIGVKISRKTLPRGDHTLNLLIWDLAGGDDFSRVSASYLRGAAGAIIVCDLTRHETLNALSYYAEQLRTLNPQAALVFVGNKVDLLDERVITDDELTELSDTFGGTCLVTSAKTGERVEAAFQILADLIEAQQ
ncbi:MAG: GTP-binding protein [Chloroflexi bacterium]|nr:MAG: GTP-binding protein [Chloroflexota bacterium]